MSKAEVVAYLFEDGEVTLASDYKYVGASRPKHEAEPLVTLKEHEAIVNELLSANADLDRLASQTAALNEKAGMRVYELEQALRACVKSLIDAGRSHAPSCKAAVDLLPPEREPM